MSNNKWGWPNHPTFTDYLLLTIVVSQVILFLWLMI